MHPRIRVAQYDPVGFGRPNCGVAVKLIHDQPAEVRKVNSLPLFKECQSYCRASYWPAGEEAHAILRSRQQIPAGTVCGSLAKAIINGSTSLDTLISAHGIGEVINLLICLHESPNGPVSFPGRQRLFFGTLANVDNINLALTGIKIADILEL